jgi:hypothetical protein
LRLIIYDVYTTNVKEVVAKLKEINPDLVKAFRADLKKVAASMATEIKASIQVTPPLSNMDYDSPRALKWSGAVTSLSVSFAGKRGREITPLLAIKVNSPKGAPGYMVGETAGRNGPVGKSGGSRINPNGGSAPGSPQGAHLIMTMTEKFGPLKGKGGNRIAWKYFWRQRATLNRAAIEVVRIYTEKATKQVNA